VAGPELDDVAHQAAGDAMLAILGKLGAFRGESQFTTWAYRFVMLEVSGYKVIFDARRKIRRALVADGYLEEAGWEQR
jgi:hypothetical protein